MTKRIIGTLAGNPVFAATMGTSAKMQVALRTASGALFRATGFVTSAWTRFHAGDRVDVYYYVKKFNGKDIRVITDIVPAGKPHRYGPRMTGTLKFDPEYKGTNGPSIMMRVVVHTRGNYDLIAHGFIETPWNAFHDGDTVELDYSVKTFAPHYTAINCVEDIRAHVAPKAETPATIAVESVQPRTFTVAETQVRHHYRTLQDGRKVFVRGHTRRYHNLQSIPA